MKLLIARFPGGNTDHPDQTDWLVKARCEAAITIAQAGSYHGVTQINGMKINDTPITMTRNRVAKTALDAGYDFLLMLDNDTIPDAYGSDFLGDALDLLVGRRELEADFNETYSIDPDDPVSVLDNGAERPMPATIAAPYCGPPPAELVYVFEWVNHSSEEDHPRFTLEMIDRRDAALRDGIQEVAALPTGCILYDVRTFKYLPPPWFEYEWTDKYQTAKASTEDVFQTRNASLAGMPQFVHWGAWAFHDKRKKVGKPQIFTRDDVHKSIRDRLVNTKRGERLVFHGDTEIARSTFQDIPFERKCATSAEDAQFEF